MSSALLSPDRLYYRIGDVAEIAGIKQHVLRYWEGEFSEIAPDKSSSGQRVYTKRDVETVLLIKKLLYTDRYSIDGAKLKLKELRRSGELHREVESVVHPADAVSHNERWQALSGARRVLQDLESLNARTLRETFRY